MKNGIYKYKGDGGNCGRSQYFLYTEGGNNHYFREKGKIRTGLMNGDSLRELMKDKCTLVIEADTLLELISKFDEIVNNK